MPKPRRRCACKGDDAVRYGRTCSFATVQAPGSIIFRIIRPSDHPTDINPPRNFRSATGRSVGSTFVFLGAIVLAACTTPRPATSTSAREDFSRTFAEQGVDAVIWQHTSAEAHRMYEQCYELARMKLDMNLLSIPAGDPRQPAVIVDVDETVLDNTTYEVEAIAAGRTFSPGQWREWCKREDAGALPGSVAFLNYAVERGCVVFYITNRAADERSFTIGNLYRLGFPMADQLHVMAKDGTSDKTVRRSQVAAAHNVVLLVGDQLTDFDERLKDRSSDHGHTTVDAMSDTLSRYFVLLPNPMYGVWRDAITGSGADMTDSMKVERVRLFFNEYLEH